MFFFSSRRRHTRLQGDWSSDVCSSDLAVVGRGGGRETMIPFVVAPAWAHRPGISYTRVTADQVVLTFAKPRSEERRVGKEGRARRTKPHEKNESYRTSKVLKEASPEGT